MHSLTDRVQRLQIVASFTIGDRFRYIRHALRSLAKRDGGDHLVLRGVDGSGGVIVLKPDIESHPVAGWPEAMWQRASGDGGYLLERIGTEDLYRVEAADRDVGALPSRIANDVDVIGDRSRIQYL